MRCFFYIILLLCTAAYASELRLCKKLAEAKPGSYLVLEQNKTFTFFYIRELTNTSIIIEEISIPYANVMKKHIHWKEWFENGAAGHSSWVISQINLHSGTFEEAFSFNHQGWIDLADSNAFLTTLLNLPFEEIPTQDRRRVGLPPGYNRNDHRPIWHPQLIVEGNAVKEVAFSAYKARWPSDGTELSRKVIEIYLPNTAVTRDDFPRYFPYWLEVEGKIGNAKIRVVDSGLNAHSPKIQFPKRPPQLTAAAEVNEKGVTFKLKSPPNYKEFLIIAEETDSFFGNFLALPCETVSGEKGNISLVIPHEAIEQTMKRGTTYRFMISPKENPEVIVETTLCL